MPAHSLIVNTDLPIDTGLAGLATFLDTSVICASHFGGPIPIEWNNKDIILQFRKIPAIKTSKY